MKIKKIIIKNFKCLGPESIKLDFSDDIIVLIGENNVGKSSVLKALDYYFSGTKTMPDDFFYNKLNDLTNAIVIEVEFNGLSSEDREHQAISPHFFKKDDENIWILKKTYYKDEDGKGTCDYTCIKEEKEIKNPGGLTQNVDDLFTNEKMQKIFVEAVKDVQEASESNDKNTFGQIFNLLLRPELEKTSEFKNLMIAVNKYSKLFQHEKKLEQISRVEKLINDKICRIIKAYSKISPRAPDPNKVLPIPKLLTNDDRPIDVLPQNQGHGLQRTLIFSLLELFAEHTSPPDDTAVGTRNLLLIEEPEIYMHPQMERKIADTLYEIARSKKAQVICSTHSPVFIRIAERQRALVRMTRGADNALQVIQQKNELFVGQNKIEQKKRLKMISNFDPSVNEAFFAKRVVLVEGDTEIAVFKEVAEMLDVFKKQENQYKRRDTTFVNCRGKWTIAAFQEVLNHFQIDYVVIHDKDEEDTESGANKKIFELLDRDEKRRKIFHKKIEDILQIPDSGKNKPFNALERVKQLNKNNQLDETLGEYINFAYNLCPNTTTPNE